MTTPTQAQIRAAAIKIAEIVGGPYAEGDSRNYLDAAKAALTAAAQVGEQQPIPFDLEPSPHEIHPSIKEQNKRQELRDRYDAVRAAAQVGEIKDPYWCYSIDDINATIERCAEVAENVPCNAWRMSYVKEVAAAIRKLREPTVDPNIIYPGKDPDFVFPEEGP